LKFRWQRLVDSQDLGATGAAAGATEIARVAGRGLHFNVEASSARDHGGRDIRREFCAANHGRRNGGAVKNNYRGGDEIAACRSKDEARWQLRENLGCRRDRT